MRIALDSEEFGLHLYAMFSTIHCSRINVLTLAAARIRQRYLAF